MEILTYLSLSIVNFFSFCQGIKNADNLIFGSGDFDQYEYDYHSDGLVSFYQKKKMFVKN